MTHWTAQQAWPCWRHLAAQAVLRLRARPKTAQPTGSDMQVSPLLTCQDPTKHLQSDHGSSGVVPNSSAMPVEAGCGRSVFLPYGVAGAGKDMTTGLLLEDTSAPGAADDDSGQLGQLRKKLNLLQGTQACIHHHISIKHERLHGHRLIRISVHWLLAFQVC